MLRQSKAFVGNAEGKSWFRLARLLWAFDALQCERQKMGDHQKLRKTILPLLNAGLPKAAQSKTPIDRDLVVRALLNGEYPTDDKRTRYPIFDGFSLLEMYLSGLMLQGLGKDTAEVERGRATLSKPLADFLKASP